MSEFIIKDRKFKVIRLNFGDRYYKDDINAISLSRANNIKSRIENDGYNFDDWSMGQDGSSLEYDDYVILRPIKELEKNEFGEVSP